jgi:hypothetical protein
MADLMVASPSPTRLPRLIRVLLIPSWIVAAGTGVMWIDWVTHSVPQLIAPIVGGVVLFGGFVIAPLTLLLASVLAIWHSLHHRHEGGSMAGRRGLGVWPLIGLSFLCLIGTLVAMTHFFTS